MSFLKVKNYLDDNKKMNRTKRSCMRKDGMSSTRRKGILAILRSARGKGKQMNTSYNETYITDIIGRKSRQNKSLKKKKKVRRSGRFSRVDDDEEEDDDELEKAIMRAMSSSSSSSTSSRASSGVTLPILTSVNIDAITDSKELTTKYKERLLNLAVRIGDYDFDKAKEFLKQFESNRSTGILDPFLLQDTRIDAFTDTEVNDELTKRFITPDTSKTLDERKTQLKDFEKIRSSAAFYFSIISP